MGKLQLHVYFIRNLAEGLVSKAFFNHQYNMHKLNTHDVRTMLYRRCYDVKTFKRRRINIVLTSCDGWGV